MAYQYPQYTQTYGPQRSTRSPCYSPQFPFMPHGTPYQQTVDAYGRPLVQQGISPIGRPAQHPFDRSGQSHAINRGPSNQYGQSPSSEPESPMYMPQNMARGYSSQSTDTDGSFPSSHRQQQAPKEKPWFCPHPGCLREDGQLMSFARKDDLNRHVQIHSPHRRTFPCDVPGCHRGGDNGLPRYDKLLEHMRETHRRR